MLTRNVAQWVVLVLLITALALGYGAAEKRSADPIGLENLPTTAGAWTCIDQKVSKPGSESKRVLRTYRQSDGCEVDTTLETTQTRLGALRDWTVARTAQGWVAQPRVARRLAASGAQPFFFTVSLQTLTKEEAVLDTLTWFTSSDDEAHTLAKAEVRGWKSRLLGSSKPWCEMDLAIVSEGGDIEDQWAVLEGLACELAPQLRQLMIDVAGSQ